MNAYHDLQPKNRDGSYNAVVEMSNGSKNKYEFNIESGILKLETVLQPKQFFIFDYGFIPQTLGGDGDPLDVIILSSNILLPMLLVNIRPIGIMRMLDENEIDDKIIAVVSGDYYWEEKIKKDVVKQLKYMEIEQWFKIYKGIDGTKLKIIGFDSENEAVVAINNGIQRYNKQKKFNKD
jgi:inorganic pyrophosphatase